MSDFKELKKWKLEVCRQQDIIIDLEAELEQCLECCKRVGMLEEENARLIKALESIKDSCSKGEAKRIAMQSLGGDTSEEIPEYIEAIGRAEFEHPTDNYIAGTKTVSNYKIRKQKEGEK